MKTNKNIKNEQTRITSFLRIFVLVALSGVATLNVLKAGESEFDEYKGLPPNVKFDLIEYRLQLALEEEPEPEMEIEDWMIDLSYWNKLLKEKSVIQEYNNSCDSDTEIGNCMSECRISIALQEEPELEMLLEDWMLDLNEFIQHIHFADK